MRSSVYSRRRRSITAAVVALLTLAGAITSTQSAQAAAPQILTFWNKCVDVRGGKTDDGTRIDEWTCNGTVSQEFTIVPLGNGYSLIKTYWGKCVDVRGGKTDDGTRIDEWTCNGTVSQEFTIVPLGNGYSLIKTYWGKCVDVRGGKSDDNTDIDEWTCNGTVSQEFAL
ncbi:RICIN domain-containing protein [Amycolatopsis halotolerans]|uniref:RICIN domain-containing protein n=1 Tax=Amycolatopsis halotolerans TaxID=330083 RepID=A0ABV7QP15_9PSEU